MQEKKKYNRKPRTRLDGRKDLKSPFPGKNPFDLEEQFRQYLQKMSLEVLVPGSTPYTEVKRAFYGGMGSFYVFFLEVVSTLPEEDGVKAMERVRDKMQAFWVKELGKTMNELMIKNKWKEQ